MKQVLQHLGNGRTEIAEVPCPRAARGGLLIHTQCSLVSAGTERMLIEFGKANLLDKARQQPDKVRMVLDKIRTDGLAPTLQAVRAKLDQPLAMGYCNVGVVVEVGAGVDVFRPGDRVASNGVHAEVVSVPVNLCCRVPDGVGDEAAAFTVLGAVALQGIRLVQPTLGEAVVVTGLGLVGLLTVQLLRAHGCRVLGIDFDPARLALARRFGAEVVALGSGADPVPAAQAFSRGRGVDAVIVTAATRSSEPMHQAAHMCRKGGRIVLVGVSGLELSRADFFEKELSFQVSCSYGPGRYDPLYEEQGHDYPIGFVRWTAQRNFEAVLDMLADGRLDVAPLISHRFDIADAARAYAVVGGAEPSLGILLRYPAPAEGAALLPRSIPLSAAAAPAPAAPPSSAARTRACRVGVIGAGQYAGAVLLPALAAAGASLQTIASATGATSMLLGRRFGFRQASTDAAALLADPDIDAAVICTRHDSHADYVVRALAAGKHVFVEKPLALTAADLERVAAAARATADRVLMVGFNRRFAPLVQRMARLLAAVPGPKSFLVTVNAGAVPPGHWTQDRLVGGGRWLGEGCHFVDLLRFLAGAPIVTHHALPLGQPPGQPRDSVHVTLGFADGSVGAIHYLCNGSRAFPKERVEVFAAGRVLQLDNFRRLHGYGWPGFARMRLWRQDKGQPACVQAFVDAVRGVRPPPIATAELIEVGRVTIALADSLG